MDVATRYKLLEKIGAGSFATVYRAEDQELGREVAVKQIHSQFLAETTQFERYWKEATLLASFQHPHIVTIYDVVRAQGWLILELMQANLRDRLQGRPMDVKAVQTTLTQGLRALSALHARGLVHGDIKPSNLMIDHRKRIKVGDFGLARRVSHDDGSVIRGTAKYMAPETLSQDFGDVGPQSDLYSLGFTAYELLCGAKFETLFPGLDAFGRDRQAAWMMWHAALDRKLPDPTRALGNIPPQLASVIGGLIEKDPKKRFATADLALAELGSAPGEPLSKSDTSRSMPVPGKASSSKRGLVIAAFCLSMAASAGMLFWNPEQPPVVDATGEPKMGVLRRVDAEARTIELVNPATGLPAELAIPPETPIRLRYGTSEELVLLKALQPGDWLQSRLEGGQLRIAVSRPASHEGKIVAVDVPGAKMTVAIETQRLRDRVVLSVPASVTPKLNGEPAALRDLAINDDVTVEHLLDPAGKLGEIASQISARRTATETVTIVDFDQVSSRLRFSSPTTGGSSRTLAVTPQTRLVRANGQAALPTELTPGRTVQITADDVIRQITLPVDAPTREGILTAVDVEKRSLTVQEDGEQKSLTLGPDATVQLNDTPAVLADLRPQNDKVVASLAGGAESSEAMALSVTRLPRFDRSVVAVAASTNRDRSIPVIDGAVEGMRDVTEAAVRRYATPLEWVQLLSEPTGDEVVSSLKQKLGSLRPNVQVLVAIAAQASVVDGKPVLAFVDYQPNAGAMTGVSLSELISQIDRTAPTQKILLLDVLHPRPGFEDVVPDSAEALLKDIPRPAAVTVFCRAPQAAGSSAGDFGKAIAAAIAGAADADRDLVVTPDEMEAFLDEKLGKAGFVRWPAAE